MIHLSGEIYVRVVFSTLAGIIMGLERTIYNKPAGTRTFSLVSLGSTLITLVSVHGAEGLGLKITPDPLRIAAQIVTGIGFIGAGVIWNNKTGVKHGITTAAELWVVSAIGMAIGVGLYKLAILVMVCALSAIFTGRQLDLYFKKQGKKDTEAEETE